MKVAELTGALLDYWVARAEGYETHFEFGEVHASKDGALINARYKPSTDWEQCGPLIEKYGIELIAFGEGWCVPIWLSGEVLDSHSFARAPQEAICRAVVRAKFGDEVPKVAP